MIAIIRFPAALTTSTTTPDISDAPAGLSSCIYHICAVYGLQIITYSGDAQRASCTRMLVNASDARKVIMTCSHATLISNVKTCKRTFQRLVFHLLGAILRCLTQKVTDQKRMAYA
jgi:hypothetical protein